MVEGLSAIVPVTSSSISPDPTLISPRFNRLRVRLRLSRSPALRLSTGEDREEAHSRFGPDPSTMLRVMVRYSNHEVLEGKTFPPDGLRITAKKGLIIFVGLGLIHQAATGDVDGFAGRMRGITRCQKKGRFSYLVVRCVFPQWGLSQDTFL